MKGTAGRGVSDSPSCTEGGGFSATKVELSAVTAALVEMSVDDTLSTMLGAARHDPHSTDDVAKLGMYAYFTR